MIFLKNNLKICGGVFDWGTGDVRRIGGYFTNIGTGINATVERNNANYRIADWIFQTKQAWQDARDRANRLLLIKFIFLALALIATSSCATWKKTLSSTGDLDVLVNNVITDFINTSSLLKADSVFLVDITDKEEYYIVGIGGPANKIYPFSKDIIGTYDDLIPNRYVVHNNKMFCWNDPSAIISEDMVNMLIKYNQIDLYWRDTYYDIPPLAHNDGKVGMVYYVCKSDFITYKKTKSNTIKKHYRMPKLRCNK